MLTYLILNCVVMALVSASLYTFWPRINLNFGCVVLILFVLTAVFDNVIIGLGIVDYHTAKILGVYIYQAPLEDFCYPLLAVIMIPALWKVSARVSIHKKAKV